MLWSYWIVAAIAAEAPSSQDLVQALEFQYQRRLQQMEAENLTLKNELYKIQAARKSQCPETSASTSEKSDTQQANLTNQESPKKSSKEVLIEEQKAYKNALRFVQLEMWDDAILGMESYARSYPRSDLADNAIFWMAQIYLQKNEMGLARAELHRLLQLYPQGDRAALAESRLKTIPTLTGIHSSQEGTRHEK